MSGVHCMIESKYCATIIREITRLRETVGNLVFLSLTHGIISRGSACEILKIDRVDLDDWMASAGLSHKVPTERELSQ